MVQEKDAAKKRVAERKANLERIRREIDENTVKTIWYVSEYTPGYNTGGYYDQDIPSEEHKVSGDFSTEQQAVAWKNRHVADDGKRLLIRRARLVRRTYTEWIIG